MFHPRLTGTYYDMGFDYGTTLFKHGFKPPEQPVEKLTFAQECETQVKRVFPEVLEEIRGFADAQKVLRDHTGLVCSHVEEIQLGTLWSLVATLKKPSIYMAEGHPCKTMYKLDTRLNKSLQKPR